MEVEITGIVPGGVGYTDLEGERVHVRETLPGDRVTIGKRRRWRGRVWAEKIGLVGRKQATRDAPCKHFGMCGGCDWMDVAYPDQLKFKQMMVVEAFRTAGLSPMIHDIASSPEEFRYRNRVDFSFGNGDGGPVIGLYERGDPRSRTSELPPVCEVADCWLVSVAMNRVKQILQNFLAGTNLRAYNPVSRSGVLRSLDVRSSRGGDLSVQLSVANEKHLPVESLVTALKTCEQPAAHFRVCVGRSRSRHAPPKREMNLFGESRQSATLLGHDISFSAAVFSQINPYQLDHLYRLALSLAQPESTDRILDLYCGVGALTIPIAANVQEAMGVEASQQAVEDARLNADTNGLTGCRFVCADAADVGQWGQPRNRFSLVTVNPPRTGVDPAVIEGIASTRADRVVYVSCNPETLARDCARLTAHAYRITDVYPVDMFPQTTHVESVARLVRVSEG